MAYNLAACHVCLNNTDEAVEHFVMAVNHGLKYQDVQEDIDVELMFNTVRPCGHTLESASARTVPCIQLQKAPQVPATRVSCSTKCTRQIAMSVPSFR